MLRGKIRKEGRVVVKGLKFGSASTQLTAACSLSLYYQLCLLSIKRIAFLTVAGYFSVMSEALFCESWARKYNARVTINRDNKQKLV